MTWLDLRTSVDRYDHACARCSSKTIATIAEFVARGLREAGFAVDIAADGEAGLDARARSSRTTSRSST